MKAFSRLFLLLLLAFSLHCQYDPIEDVVPPLTISWSPAERIGVDEDITFSADAPYAVSYRWDFGDEDSSFVASPVKAFAYPGVFSVYLTVTMADGKTFSASVELFIDPFKGRMVSIPGGSFMMGCNDLVDDSCEPGLEVPRHEVTLQPFYLCATEITQDDWLQVMGEVAGSFPCSDCPVETVSWLDVQTFIERLNTLTGYTYYLPSEAQWEYAARAGDTSLIYAGSNILDDVAWYGGDPLSQPQPVATKQPNAWGLYDMSGNVLELCQDHYHDNYNGAPTDGSAWIDPTVPDDLRVIRGGSYIEEAVDCRITARRLNIPQDQAQSSIGFRLARE